MKFRFKGKEYYIDGRLALQLNSICYNLQKDWDFILLITGDRTVRTGKSVLAMTVCAYLAMTLNKMKTKSDFSLENIFFSSRKMLSDVLNYPPHSIVMYDEGRESLSSTKMFTDIQKDILDYFAECGQLNHIFVVVLPDFFSLVEEMAVARSECLINVYRKHKNLMLDVFKTGEKIPIVRFDRGRFEFFSRIAKQKLYDKAKATRRRSYGLQKATLIGSFTNQYTVDEKKYRKKKKEWLTRFKERKEAEMKVRKTDIVRDTIIIEQHNSGQTSTEIGDFLLKKYKYKIDPASIRRIIRRIAQKREIGGTVR